MVLNMLSMSHHYVRHIVLCTVVQTRSMIHRDNNFSGSDSRIQSVFFGVSCVKFPDTLE
jgi:hypothetical protein